MLVNKEQLYWTWNNGLVQHWEKGVHQIYILLPCLFNFYAENILNNAELDEVQAGIKFAKGNISNLRYAGYTTLMAESEEELKNPLMKVKGGSGKADLNSTLKKLSSWHPVPSLHS